MAKQTPMDFTTTNKIKEISPGLTYENPQSIPASFNTTGAIAQGLTEGIKVARKVKDQYIDDVATDAANQLSQEYLQGSETYTNDLQQRKLRLQDDLSKDAGNSAITDEIDMLNEKLTLASDQGRIGPGEMKHRMMTKAAELTSNNPAYQVEIAQKMNTIFAATGVNDIIASDSALLKARQTAIIAQRTKMIEEVETYVGDTSGMTDPQIQKAYGRIKNVQADGKRTEEFVSMLKGQDQKTKLLAYNAWREDDGLQRTNSSVYGNLQLRLREIAKTDMNIDDKADLARSEIVKAKSKVNGIIASFPEGVNEGPILTANLVTDLQRMEQSFIDRADKTNVLREITNHVGVQLQTDNLNVSKRYNLAEIEVQEKLASIADKLRVNNVPAFNDIVKDVAANVIILAKGIRSTDPIAERIMSVDGPDLPMKIATNQHEIALESIKKTGTIDDQLKVFYTSALTLPSSTYSGVELLEFQEQKLRPYINSMPEPVLGELVNDQNFAMQLKNQLDVYTETARQGLYAVIGDAELNLSANRTNSTLFITAENNPDLSPLQINLINDSLKRITDIAMIDNKVAKVSGKSEPIDKTVNDLLTKFFPKVNLGKE